MTQATGPSSGQPPASPGSRLPALGPRGEGWVLAQVVLLVVIGIAGAVEVAGHWPAQPWGAAGFTVGLLAILAGGLFSVFGIWNLRPSLSPFPRPMPGRILVETGVYRLIRHPIYSGLVLAAAGWGLACASAAALAATVLLALLFNAKALLEEGWLCQAYPDYDDYQARTKRFIPHLY
ncbi:MAG: methyltransferase family protein [Candidatus Limnocylindrales bacterium]